MLDTTYHHKIFVYIGAASKSDGKGAEKNQNEGNC